MNPNTNEEDRLSNLPDDVLTRILSHLQLKEIVRSGILSKQWKSVWLSVPTLVLHRFDFALRGEHRTHYDARARFSNFVNEFLVARKLPSLDNISLHSYQIGNHHLVKSWVRSALERDVSKLKLNYDDDEYYDENHSPCELTPNLFSYNKLVVLKLEGYVAPNFPKNSSCFPSLKELELDDVHYQDCDSLPNLLSSCPILENLTIVRKREWDRFSPNTGTLIITSRWLKRLTVCCEIDTWHIGQDEFKMVIDVPAVEYLYLQSFVTEEYVVKDLPSLVEAEFDFMDLSVLLEILKSSPQLEILKLGFLQIEEYVSMLPELDVPSCLTMRLKSIDNSCNSCNTNVNMLSRYLLMNSKVLERMTIRGYFKESSKLELCNFILESGANAVTWLVETEDDYREVVISFSEPRI